MNLYQPHLMRIEEMVEETGDTRTLKLKFEKPSIGEQFDFIEVNPPVQKEDILDRLEKGEISVDEAEKLLKESA